MEGGAIISHDEKTKKRIDYLKNFGFKDEVTVIAAGINSKMNEMQSALGILQLKSFKKNVLKRKEIADIYFKNLSQVKGIRAFEISNDQSNNYSYFPIFIENDFDKSRDELYEILKNNKIFGRRYFYPLVSNFPIYKRLESSNPSNLKIANKIADKVICLPIYPGLQKEIVYKIIDILKL